MFNKEALKFILKITLFNEGDHAVDDGMSRFGFGVTRHIVGCVGEEAGREYYTDPMT